MRHIVQTDQTVSRLNQTDDSSSSEEIDGFGNYNLEVAGVAGSGLQNKSVLDLYFLDSGDYSTVPSIPGYGWIKPSQQLWFQRTSDKLQEGISSASINSLFFPTMVEAGDVKAVFIGDDHINDFCGQLMNIHLCYASGFGYHAYRKAGWSRSVRVVLASLEKTNEEGWEVVKSIKTWKRLDDPELSTIDSQTLWIKCSTGTERRRKGTPAGI